MKLIEDLGVVKGKHRLLIECQVCKQPHTVIKSIAKQGNGLLHKACSNSNRHVGKETVSGTRLYSIYNNMKQRCLNVNKPNYCDYGGRGITICKEWLSSFTTFKEWALANGYEKHLSIDRRDNNNGYSPDNCRWVKGDIQAQNQRLRGNATGYKGVSLNGYGRYCARVQVEGSVKSLGCYSTALEAAIAYDSYVITNKLEHTTNGVL